MITDKLTDDQLAEFRQRRQSFKPWSDDSAKRIAFYYSPALQSPYSTNTQNLPAPSADRLADVSDDELRSTVALSFLRVGFGEWSDAQQNGRAIRLHRAVGNQDDPPGRQGAYLDVIMPFDREQIDGKHAGKRSRWVGADDAQHTKSSCGLFIRGMWQLLGAGQPAPGTPEQELRTDYDSNHVLVELPALADGYGALHGPPFGDPDDEIRLGDVFLVKHGDGQHIFTVCWLEPITDRPLPSFYKKQLRVYSVDGGNGSYGDEGGFATTDPCIGITSFTRDLYWDGRSWTVDKYTVVRHIKLAQMKASFVEPWILPYTP